MPGGDKTGPSGEGPMTGRAAGYCAGYDRPGFTSGRGFGRGRGRGGGFGNRNRFYATGVPFRAYAGAEPEALLPRNEEIALLKSESQRLRSILETIEQRLAKIETA